MEDQDPKGDLHTYLRDARETLVWKLAGLGEYDVRRPLTPTGTNLLGLVKHSGATHVRYFGSAFGRSLDPSLQWLAGGLEPGAEMWATETEGRGEVVDACRRAWAVADSVITELPLDAEGMVPWWGPAPVTLGRVLVHVTAETQRHVGHADILRELVDGRVGLLEGADDMRIVDRAGQGELHRRIEAAARLAGDR